MWKEVGWVDWGYGDEKTAVSCKFTFTYLSKLKHGLPFWIASKSNSGTKGGSENGDPTPRRYSVSW